VTREVIVGITGASGAPVALALLRALLRRDDLSRLHLILSDWAPPVLAQELESPGLDGPTFVRRFLEGDRRITLWRNDQMAAPIASGSHPTAGMVVVPCSVQTLGAIASGLGDRLLLRAADVTIKERRPLLLAVRETPLSAIHIENMRRVTGAGATVFPIAPAYYARPKSLAEMDENFVARLMDHLGMRSDRGFRWGEPPAQAE
jgi:4-hydroxy-3-polyprenylbenzoate decarboxylase